MLWIIVDYCGLLWDNVGYLFCVLDAVMSSGFLSTQIYNQCCFKLYENYENFKLVLYVKTSSLKVIFNCSIIWKVYIVNIWYIVKLHGKTFQDMELIQQWST